jgi:two-component system response regulator ChvI
MARIALIDAEISDQSQLTTLLIAEGFDLQLYLAGAQAIEDHSKRPFDILITDINLPNMDGFEIVKQLRQKSSVPVICLSAVPDEVDELLAFRLGADDYIGKSAAPRLVFARIRAILRRVNLGADQAALQTAKPIRRGRLLIDPQRHAVQWDGQSVALTVTEFSLLMALAQHPGYVRSRDQLMDLAYDDQVYVDDRTIDSHIKRLRKKIRTVDATFNAIETLYGVGYRYNDS